MSTKSVSAKYRGKLLSAHAERSVGSYIPYGISTQSLNLDIAIGCPGIPGARLTQVFGLDGTGKSTLMLHLLAECQRMGGKAVLFDTEECYDLKRAERVGVNLKNLLIASPDTLEELLDMLVDISTEYKQDHNPEKEPLLFVVDSAEGVPSKSTLDLEADDSKAPAAIARVWNGNLVRLLRKVCKENRSTLIVVCQQYHKIGAPSYPGAPPPLEIKSGVGLRYRASLRVEIKARTGKSSLDERDGKIVGYRNSFKTVKNKSAAPYQEAEYHLSFENGIDKYVDLLEAGVEQGLIKTNQRGMYGLNLKSGEKVFKKDDWKALVDKLGGPDKLRKFFTNRLIRTGVIKPYGMTEDEDE